MPVFSSSNNSIDDLYFRQLMCVVLTPAQALTLLSTQVLTSNFFCIAFVWLPCDFNFSEAAARMGSRHQHVSETSSEEKS